MEFDLFPEKQKLGKDKLSKLETQEFRQELENSLRDQNVILVVDRFEGQFAICENRETKEMITINKKQLPKEAKEGSILRYQEGDYSLDSKEEEIISNRIKEKMNRLWK